VVAVALPLLAHSGPHAEAAPMQQPQPNHAQASSTPGDLDETAVHAAAVEQLPLPQATVAFVMQAGASPAPVPDLRVSQVAP
jgi:hypothetical protein